MKKDICAIILAAGMGTRILPYSKTRNKVLFKVDGEPLLKRHIRKLKQAGFTRIFITAYHLAYQLQQVIDYNDTSVMVYIEKKLKDSGIIVQELMDSYKIKRSGVLYGDTWFKDSNYAKFYQMVKGRNNSILVDKEDRINAGMVALNRSVLKGEGDLINLITKDGKHKF